MIGQVQKHAAAVGLGHVEELGPAKRREHVGRLAVKDVLQCLRLVIVGVLDGLIHFYTGLGREVFDDVGQDIFVLGPPMVERDFGAFEVIGRRSGVGCTRVGDRGNCGGSDFHLAPHQLGTLFLANERAHCFVGLLLGARTPFFGGCGSGDSSRSHCTSSHCTSSQHSNGGNREPSALHVMQSPCAEPFRAG